MDPERWKRIDALFQAAVDLPDEALIQFLDRECADDKELRREVDLLLDADRRGGDFIEARVGEVAAGLLAKITQDVAEGTRIAHYRVLSRIGAGGMGEVYRAEDTTLGRVVALKLLPSWMTSDPALRGRFLREARLTSVLNHPNVCPIHEVGRSGEQLFIAMRYVEGLTLKQMVAQGPIELKRIFPIAIQMAEGIAAAHRKGIVHRDVKSSNVVVTTDGQAVVLDFGLAKVMDDGVRQSLSVLTKPGSVLGTPAYMSPEQARGETADHRSDIFSLGVVIYELVTGCTPFERKSHAETLTAVVREPHAPLAKLRPNVPPALSAIIDQALAKKPSDRYQSMESMRDDLTESIRGDRR